MKILFVGDNFPPEVNASATRTWEHCREWVRAGAQVTVITCAPNFPQGKLYPGYRNKLRQIETIDGIKVVRVWSYMSANKGFVRRIIDYMSFAFSASIAGLRESGDVIVATSPQFFTSFAVLFLSLVKRKAWVFELRDLWPESIHAVGAMRNGKVLWMLEKIELFMYRKAEIIVAVTEAFRKDLVERGIAEHKIFVVPNGVNLEVFSHREKDEVLVRELSLEKKFVVGYIGTHGMAHGLEDIIEAIGRLKSGKVHFLFIGDGARKMAVVDAARRLKLANVTFLDPIPKEKVPDYLSVMDAALVPLIKSETFRKVIPSKIFEAAAMGKPILLGVEGQAREIVEKHDAGLCYEPGNSEDFLVRLDELIKSRGNYVRFTEGCARLARQYDRKKTSLFMLDILDKTVSG